MLEVACDKAHEQFIKCDKGKVSNRIRQTRQRHPNTNDLPNIVTIEDQKWKVTSSDGNESYTVEKLKNDCTCKLKCSLCDVCLHMFSCACIDYLIQSVACKHTHAVRMLSSGDIPDSSADNADHDDNDFLQDDTTAYYKKILSKSEQEISRNLNESVRTAMKKISELTDLLKNAPNVDVVQGILHHVNAAMSVGKGLSVVGTDHDYQTKRSFSSNKVFDTQARFYSTKKKRKKTKDSLFKLPAKKEKTDLSARLDAIETKVCGICFKEFDQGQGAIQDWRQCSKCFMWVHTGCDVLIVEDSETEYLCLVCRSA